MVIPLSTWRVARLLQSAVNVRGSCRIAITTVVLGLSPHSWQLLTINPSVIFSNSCEGIINCYKLLNPGL